MASKFHQLSAKKIEHEKKAGLHPDGAGLYLRVSRKGSKSWSFRYQLHGKPREMGLGGLTKVGLADARKKAAEVRTLLGSGRDPLDLRQEEETKRAAAQKLEAALAMSFDKCAEAYISTYEISWKNEKHRQQWRNTLSSYVSPVFGSIPVQDVDVEHVMKVIEPMWATKTETARRIRGRIETILDWAKVRGYRSGENPARWRGHLSHLLPARNKVRAVKHHPALPYEKIGTFMKALRSTETVSSAALEFLILTVARTNEVIGARWSEIDFKNHVWTVPSERMKSGREHRVPLPAAAIRIVKRMEELGAEYVFPGQSSGAPLSNMALLMTLGRMGYGEITSHGFRSTFRDWAAECTNFPTEVVEMALAHAIEDRTEAAYRRGDLFEKRRTLMAEWESYCATSMTDRG